jgi:mono/diheme cytochrome c family protein
MRAGGCVLLCAALLACERPAEQGDADLARMIEQPRYDAYEASAFFSDSAALRRPPEGTVPREARDTLRLPIAVTPAMLERGRDRFGIFCAVCHGSAGDGKSIVAANMHDPAPPSLIAGTHAAHGPAHIYDVVTNGSGRMPSYAAELDPEDRWAVVAWVLRLRR